MGWGITGTMLSGIIVWGGAGWLLDRWLETHFFILVGVILGLGVAIYLVVVKYGAVAPPSGGRRPTGTTPAGSDAGQGRTVRRRRDNGDLQRLSARQRARSRRIGGDGFQAPTVEEFYPEPLVSFALLGVDFEITRITLILWVATAAMIALLVAAVRKPSIVPGKLQFLGESGYSLVRDGIARDVIGPEGPAVRALPRLAVLLHPGEQRDVHRAAGADLADVEVRVPVGSRGHHLGRLQLGRHPRAGAGRYFKDAAVPPGVPIGALILVTPIELLQVFVIRPFTLAVRLFANMFAGHMLLAVFSLGTVYLLQVGNFSAIFSVGAFAMALAMTFFELLVIVLQAYVFTVLTATYLNGAVEPAH